MDELKEKLAALGIETDKVDEILETVLGFFKDKLPDGMSGIVESMMGGEDGGGADDLIEKAKGFFGG